MKTIVLSAAVLAAALAGSTLAAKTPSTPSAQDIVAVRQAGMTMSVITLGSIRNTAEKSDSVKGAAFAARGLANWAKVVPAMFPVSTAKIAGTEALPGIWSNRTDFEAKAAAFGAATQAMLAAAQVDDKAALAAAVDSTAKACKGCHDVYRKPPPPKPAG